MAISRIFLFFSFLCSGSIIMILMCISSNSKKSFLFFSIDKAVIYIYIYSNETLSISEMQQQTYLLSNLYKYIHMFTKNKCLQASPESNPFGFLRHVLFLAHAACRVCRGGRGGWLRTGSMVCPTLGTPQGRGGNKQTEQCSISWSLSVCCFAILPFVFALSFCFIKHVNKL